MFDIIKFLNKHKDLQEITSDKIYLDNQKTKFDPNGLMSEPIFGPVKSYNCTCGKLSVKILSGKVCPVCKVKCTSNDERYKLFARIRIPFPIMSTLNKKHLQRVTTRDNKNLLSPVQFDLNSTSKMFLNYDSNLDKLTIVNTFINDKCVPILITGNFSFYIALYVISKLYNSPYAERCLNYFFFDLLVLPPGARQPFIKDTGQKKKIINSSFDDVYIPILRHKKYKEVLNFNFLEKLEEYSSMVISSIRNQNFVALEDPDLILYDKIASTFQYYTDLLYNELLLNISGKNGMVR